MPLILYVPQTKKAMVLPNPNVLNLLSLTAENLTGNETNVAIMQNYFSTQAPGQDSNSVCFEGLTTSYLTVQTSTLLQLNADDFTLEKVIHFS